MLYTILDQVTAENEMSMLVSIQTQEGTSVRPLNQSEFTSEVSEYTTQEGTSVTSLNQSEYTTEEPETTTLSINIFPFIGRLKMK